MPTALIGLLVLLPFIDRKPERNPALRPIAMLCLAVYAGTILTLTVIGYLSPGYAEMPASPAKTVAQQQSSAKAAQPQPGTASPSAPSIEC